VQVNDSNRRRRSIGRLGLACLVLQLALAPNIGIADGRINFALVFAAYVALTTGGRTGVLCGFLGGLAFDLCTTGPFGLMTLLLTVGSFVLGMEDRNRIAEDLSGSITIFLIVSFIVTLIYHLAMFLVGQASSFYDVFVLRTLPTFGLTAVAFLPFALVGSHGSGAPLSSIRGGAGSVRRRPGKFDLGNL
jgi:rod shape-determining protein MreD